MLIERSVICAFCGDAEIPAPIKVTERMFGMGDEFRIASCSRCQSIQLLDVPSDLGVYYPSDYYAHQPLILSSPGRRFLKGIRYRLYAWTGLEFFKPVFADWMTTNGTGLHDAVADIGCGNGQLLYEMNAAGFANLSGYDPFLEGEKILAPGLSLHRKSIFEIEGKFDLLMMHHAFEHMPNPGGVLEKAFQLLHDRGSLLIRVPVADAEVWKAETANWVQIDAPRHLHIPSVAGLVKLAESCGFHTKAVVFDSTAFQFWGTELYKRGRSLWGTEPSAVFSKNELARFQQKAQELNDLGKGDQACFYFVKS